MSKARTLANLISDNAELADGQISVAEVVGAAPTASPTFTGNVEVVGDIQLDATDASLFLKSGATGTSGYVNWTFNTDATVFAKAGIDYDSRSTVGFHLDSGYPISLDAVMTSTRGLDILNGGSLIHRINTVESAFNENSLNHDFRVESDNYSHMLFVDAGNNHINIGGSADSGGMLNVSGDIVLSVGSGNPGVTIKTAGTGNNPHLNYRAGDNIVFDNMLVASASTDYWRVGFGSSGSVTTEVLTVNTNSRVGINTTEPDAEVHISGSHPHIDLGPKGGNRAKLGFRYDNLYLGATAGGAEVILKNNIGSTDAPDASGDEIARFGDTIAFNESGRDQDFRVESDGVSHAIFVDAGSDKVSFWASATDTQNVEGSLTAPVRIQRGLNITHTLTASGNSRDTLNLDTPGSWALSGNAGTPTSIRWSNGTGNTMGRIGLQYSGTESGGNSEFVIKDLYQGGFGASGKVAVFGSNKFSKFMGGLTVNEDSLNHDFRVESDGLTHALFVDAGNNIVSIGSGSPYTSGRLEVFAQNDLSKEGISINGVNSATSFRLYTLGNVAKIGRGGDHPSISIDGTHNVIINDDSEDHDFRVESNNETHALFVEAGEDRVGINNSNPSYTLHVGDSSNENMGIGWMRKEVFSVTIHSSDTRWYKLANYSTGIMLQGQLFMSAARNGGANQTNGARMQHGSLAGYNNGVNTGDWGDVGTNFGHTNYYVFVGSDDHAYLRVGASVYGGQVYCMFQGRANWTFDGSYVTSEP